jgi:DNA-binding winged helix-turn-helix (wHTH) protein
MQTGKDRGDAMLCAGLAAISACQERVGTGEVIVRVGRVEIDPRRFEVRTGSAVLTLEPRVFDFLIYLARHRDRVVTKNELVAEVWAGCHVGDAALARCASLARKALGDPGLIVTVHRRGYRWR